MSGIRHNTKGGDLGKIEFRQILIGLTVFDLSLGPQGSGVSFEQSSGLVVVRPQF